MASIELYSVRKGELVDWNLEVDANGEILASHDGESIKFPAGLTKAQFSKLVKEHNKANEGLKGLTEADQQAEAKVIEDSQKLIDSL